MQKQQGVITASAGNHAQGVAFSARQLRIKALIVMPATTPPIKLYAVKALGAEVIRHGDNYSEAAERCQQLIEDTGMTYIHPFDDEKRLSLFLEKLGYRYVEETEDPAYRLFL